MSTFRYVAVPRGGSGRQAGGSPMSAEDRDARRTGEMAGASAADVRAALRRIGYQVIEIKPVRSTRRSVSEREGGGAGGGRAGSALGRSAAHAGVLPARPMSVGGDGHARVGTGSGASGHATGPVAFLGSITVAAQVGWLRHLRGRRRLVRADLCDSLATMLDAGVPLLEAVGTVLDAGGRDRSPRRTLLVQVRDDLGAGRSVAEAARLQPGWFDAGEVAMIEAGQRRGELADVLRHLASRHERQEAIVQRLTGALVYPVIVLIAGLGVATFLGVRTLPELASVLEGSGIAVPGPTLLVMRLAEGLVLHWPVLLTGAVLLLLAAWIGRQMLRERSATAPRWLRRLVPGVLRRAQLAGLCDRLSELLRTGVPLEEALQVTAPTLGSGVLRDRLHEAARALERGAEIADALDDPEWFDAEFRRLVAIGQASGELDDILARLARRYERQATRLVDRLVTLMEPAVIVILAILVGTVVMAAILPFLRLQEILG